MSTNENGHALAGVPTDYDYDAHIVNLNPSQETKARQRKLILDALLVGPLTTLAAREVFGIMSPAARVMEARRAGHNIETVRRIVWDSEGRPHRSAEYVLRGAA